VVDLLWLLEHAKVLAEPAATCTLSAARRLRGRLDPAGHLVLVLYGGSLSLDELAGFRARVGL
jgi:threonine dehydratase